jgi:hypothetical protein
LGRLQAWIGPDTPGGGGDCFLAVLGLGQFLTGIPQQIAQDLPVILLIFDHKDVPAHDGLACCLTLVGTVNENVDPCRFAGRALARSRGEGCEGLAIQNDSGLRQRHADHSVLG